MSTETVTALSPVKAIEVPAVSTDLFGGGGKAIGERYTTAGNIVARVDGAPIFALEVERLAIPILERLGTMDPADREERQRQLRSEILERLIDRQLAVQEATRSGYKPETEAVRRRMAEISHSLAGSGLDVRHEAEKDLIMQEMRRRVAERPASATPSAVREYYNSISDTVQRPAMLALNQVVIFEDRSSRTDPRPMQAIAVEISRKLETGTRFDDIRRHYDESSRETTYSYSELLPESSYSAQVLAAAGDLRVGAVFGPVVLPGLTLFAKVMDRRPGGPVPFDEMEKEIRTLLENRSVEKELDFWFSQLRQRAVIELYPEE